MPESTSVNPNQSGLEIQTEFVRGRNALFTKADFGPLFVDYYLHLSEHGLRYTPEQDALFRDCLAAMVLHCASRPSNEITAWTLHFEDLGWNVFLNGENETGIITGRLFAEDVRKMESSFFYSDVIRGTQPKRRSVAAFTGSDPLAALEHFYRHSEQRGVKAFRLGGDDYALVSEHPDCDLAWFQSLDAEKIVSLPTQETVAPLERRIYRWHCGCNQGRMLQVLAPVFKKDAEGLFGGDESVEIRCPRCGAKHRVSRLALEAYVDAHPET